MFEKTLSFGVKTKPACPKCGSKKTKKMLSMPGIVFKGSGFYKTDSATAKKSPEPKIAEPAKKIDAPGTDAAPKIAPDTKPKSTAP